MIESGVGIGVIPESAARRHSKTMKLATIQLDEPWAIRERSMLVRDIEALPKCVRALIETLQRHGGATS
ncbi:LysR substrate binding domain protein [compost metagenome]